MSMTGRQSNGLRLAQVHDVDPLNGSLVREDNPGQSYNILLF